jgi:hypothetical protein
MSDQDPGIGLLRAIISMWINQQGQTEDTNIGVAPPLQIQSLMGPTGRLFPNQNGESVSTEISGVHDSSSQPSQFSFSPMLVPGQVGVNSLLQGQQPTWMQQAFARDWSQQHPQQLQNFKSVPEALGAEQWRHTLLEQMLRGAFSNYTPNAQGYSLNPSYNVPQMYQPQPQQST